MNNSPSLARAMLAEVVGTFILIFFGLGAVHSAVLTGAQSGLWQVAIVWGVAIMLASYTIGGISGAHINPAMTLALAAWRGFPAARVLPYILAQLVGSILAAACLFFLFSAYLKEKEVSKRVVRGGPGSEITAMCYGEYYPNPGNLGAGKDPYSAAEHAQLRRFMTMGSAFFAEFLGTLILGFVVFAVTETKNEGRPSPGQEAVFIGLTVAVLISVLAPLTQACFNPARDFGPRLFASMAGWGTIALPGFNDLGWLVVYIIAPCTGAITGGALHDKLIRPGDATAKSS